MPSLLLCLTTLVEGLVTFISPCVLPMLPVYVLYFAGDAHTSQGKTLLRALCFVAGFTLLFIALGVFAGAMGSLLATYSAQVNIIMGVVMILFGLRYAGFLHIALLEKSVRPAVRMQAEGYASCVVLGFVFAVGWSPCMGTFLGSAMMMATGQGHVAEGVILLLCYSIGLGVPFVLCALLIDQVKTAFILIKRHYDTINRGCGIFLVAIGVLMMMGWFSRLPSMLSFTN